MKVCDSLVLRSWAFPLLLCTKKLLGPDDALVFGRGFNFY